MHDVIIVGGGPAGLNAALILGRCRRDVLLCDAGTPRNAVTARTWGVFTRDGTPPLVLRAKAEADLARYDTVVRREVEVVSAQRRDDGFTVTLSDGTEAQARKLILATGLHQALPDVDGFEAYWGHGVHSCPYCDGYENRDRPLVAYAYGAAAKGMALELTVWSRDVTLCTDAKTTAFSPRDREQLEGMNVTIVETAIRRLEGDGEQPHRIVFVDGGTRPCHAVFLMPMPCDPSRLITQLGCDLTQTGIVPTGAYETTNVPGLFVAGDASRRVQFAVVAAAEGAMAAFAANTELLRADVA
jgi:thioredoxin reductase